MNSLIYINEADRLRLLSIIQQQSRPPFPNLEESQRLQQIITEATIREDQANNRPHVAFGDLVTLVSPFDSGDYYKFCIVMPNESAIDEDQLSVCLPVAAAVLGRGLGDAVKWTTANGSRDMRIIAIRKFHEAEIPGTVEHKFNESDILNLS